MLRWRRWLDGLSQGVRGWGWGIPSSQGEEAQLEPFPMPEGLKGLRGMRGMRGMRDLRSVSHKN